MMSASALEGEQAMNKMLVAVFDTEPAAYEGLHALKDLHEDGDITLYATAVLVKDSAGTVSVKQTADRGAARHRSRHVDRQRHRVAGRRGWGGRWARGRRPGRPARGGDWVLAGRSDRIDCRSVPVGGQRRLCRRGVEGPDPGQGGRGGRGGGDLADPSGYPTWETGWAGLPAPALGSRRGSTGARVCRV